MTSPRDLHCPICGSKSEILLALHFGKKMELPTHPKIAYCPNDNFAFLTDARQEAYDAYYKTVINDYRHRETAPTADSPLALQVSALLEVMPLYFAKSRRVLDYGCGGADLIMSLAQRFPASQFVGYDPSASVESAAALVNSAGLANVGITGQASEVAADKFDFIIASHVFEHFIDLDEIKFLANLLAEDGALYAEVPDAARYDAFPRRAYLGYFDRIHVNHFSPQSLARAVAQYGLGQAGSLQYDFPYPDGGKYPALGMFFKKSAACEDVSSPDLRASFDHYFRDESANAREMADQMNAFGGILVWGGGDNFYRSMSNGGPLSFANNIILLDRRPQEIEIGSRCFTSLSPDEGLRKFSFPVAVTVSEAGNAIAAQIKQMDPGRKIFLL